jgi:hypothetical protein
MGTARREELTLGAEWCWSHGTSKQQEYSFGVVRKNRIRLNIFMGLAQN